MAPSSNVDLTAHSPPARIPKLKYRNPLPSDQVSLSSQLSQSTGNSSASVQERPTTPGSQAATSSSRPSCDTASLTSPSLASTASSAASSNDSRSSKKKKKTGSVLGFLSLKEPSQLALEQFAEKERKQTAGKGTSSPSSKTSSTYFGQKLPPNVPKVNSKWDGVPDAVKNRYSTTTISSKDHTKDYRSSVSSRGSLGAQLKATTWNESKVTVRSNETRNPPNSIASPVSSTSDLSVVEHISIRGSSPSTTTLPEISYYFPHGAAANAPAAIPVESPPRLSSSTYDTRSSIDESLDFRADSPASSTDSVDTIVRDTADTIFRKLNDQSQPTCWTGDAPAVQPLDDECVPDTHDFLFSEQPIVEHTKHDSPIEAPEVPHYAPSRPVQNFSRPMSSNTSSRPSSVRSSTMSSYRRTPSSSALPTLYEASLASTESLDTIRDDGDAQSIAPSTIAPSELSKHWYESPRERLGLGGRLRMNDVSPWDNHGETLGKPKKSRLSMFGKGISRA